MQGRKKGNENWMEFGGNKNRLSHKLYKYLGKWETFYMNKTYSKKTHKQKGSFYKNLDYSKIRKKDYLDMSSGTLCLFTMIIYWIVLTKPCMIDLTNHQVQYKTGTTWWLLWGNFNFKSKRKQKEQTKTMRIRGQHSVPPPPFHLRIPYVEDKVF